jgi:hypothetical protein
VDTLGENDDMQALPLIDEHTVVAAAPARATWEAARARLDVPLSGVALRYARLAGVRSDRLFDVERAESPALLGFTGQHRFSRYRLTFTTRELRPGTTALTATTNAVFPGVLGRLYRLVVIESHAHAVITKGMLRRIARQAERQDPHQGQQTQL